MDTQTKIEVFVGTSPKQIIKIEETLREPVFYFSEYVKTTVKFDSNNDNDYLEIESYNQPKHSDIKLNNDSIIRLKPGNQIDISKGHDDEDMLVPGNYIIKVCKDNKIYQSSYKVIPNNTSANGITSMRTYVDDVLYGLSYNIYKERKYTANDATEQMNYIYKHIEEECRSILSSINMIVDNPIMDITKRYDTRSYSKKSDSKSDRWSNSKGAKYFTDDYIDKYYEKHSQITYDIEENKTIRSILEYIYNLIIDINNKYIKAISIINDDIKKLQESGFSLELKKKEFSDKYGYTKSNNNNTLEIRLINNKIIDENKKIEVLKKYLNSSNKLKNQLSYYVNETWFKNIKSSTNKLVLTNKLFKNKNYLQVYELYTRLYLGEDNKFKQKHFMHKRSSQLFEIYVFLIVKEMFEELGFVWVDGWFKNNDNIKDIINTKLDSGEIVILKKDNIKVIISYDKVIKRDIEVKGSNDSQIISSFVNNRQPDILISLYKDEEFVSGIVIEAKYRPKKSIYDEENNNDVVYQLLSYRGFVYYDGSTKKVSTKHIKPISKVITVFIDNNQSFVHDMYDDVIFISINPINKNGFKELKVQIEKELDKVREENSYFEAFNW